MKTQYYTATSLDGFIATEDDSIEWLYSLGGDDALNQIGLPDHDSHLALKTRESANVPSTIEHRRLIQYQHLSPVANVAFTERQDGSAFWQLNGKPKG